MAFRRGYNELYRDIGLLLKKRRVADLESTKAKANAKVATRAKTTADWKIDAIAKKRLANQVKNYKSVDECIDMRLEDLWNRGQISGVVSEEDKYINNYLDRVSGRNVVTNDVVGAVELPEELKLGSVNKPVGESNVESCTPQSRYFESGFRTDTKLNENELSRLKGFVINKINKEQKEVSKIRKETLSISPFPQSSNEIHVHTYTDINMIKFVKLLLNFHTNTVDVRYYTKLVESIDILINDRKFNGNFISKLRPSDLEILIKALIFSDKVLTSEQKNLLEINRINNYLFNKMEHSNMKLSNKELFSLLKISSGNLKKKETINNLKNIYVKFRNSESFNKNLDFFRIFLNMNISLNSRKVELVDPEFVVMIIQDLIDQNVKPDITIINLLIKYAILVEDADMFEAVTEYYFMNYYVELKTFRIILNGIDVFVSNGQGLIQELKKYEEFLEEIAFFKIDLHAALHSQDCIEDLLGIKS